MNFNLNEFKKLLLQERNYAINEMLKEIKIFDAKVLDVSKNVVKLECGEAGFFESGDVVGIVEEGHIKILGTVLDVEGGILTVYSEKALYNLSEDSRFRIC